MPSRTLRWAVSTWGERYAGIGIQAEATRMAANKVNKNFHQVFILQGKCSTGQSDRLLQIPNR